MYSKSKQKIHYVGLTNIQIMITCSLIYTVYMHSLISASDVDLMHMLLVRSFRSYLTSSLHFHMLVFSGKLSFERNIN